MHNLLFSDFGVRLLREYHEVMGIPKINIHFPNQREQIAFSKGTGFCPLDSFFAFRSSFILS